MPSQTPLLVPISLDALLVNVTTAAGNAANSWTRGLVDYSLLSTFEDPLPDIGAVGQTPGVGVHLHWALPKALLHATQITATGRAVLAGDGVASLSVENAGAGYIAPPTVTLSGGGGTDAAAVAILTDGKVSGFTLVSGGQGYTSAPKVEVTPSPEIDFPLVPNRWLITRIEPVTATNAPRKTKSWVVASDEIGAHGTSAFVDPTTSKAGDVKASQMGVLRELSAWSGETGAAGTDLFLRAIGPGEISFHAYQPGAENVFGIYDDLDLVMNAAKIPEVPFADGAEFTYQVVGWYSDPSADPMYGPVSDWGDNNASSRTSWANSDDPLATWTAMMAQLNWLVEDAPTSPDELPDQSLYHGMLHSLSWLNTGFPKRVNQSSDGMTVSIGNTTADALSAYIAAHAASTEVATLEINELEALSLNALKTLDQADGPAQIEMLMHKVWFSSVPGGTKWEVVQNADDDFAGLSAAAAPQPDPLTPAQLEQLATLNSEQVALDVQMRELQSMKWSLFAAWWKNASYQADPYKEDAVWKEYVHDPQAILDKLATNLDPTKPGLFSDVQALERAIASNPKEIPQASNPVSVAHYALNVLKLDPEKWTLKAVNGDAFHAPSDPVVLVAGLQPSNKQKSQFPQYQQGTGWDDKLQCRFFTQATSGILSGVSSPTDASPASTFKTNIPTVTSPNFPTSVQSGITAMLTETFLSDPQNAASIVSVVNGGNGTAAQTQKLADAISNFTAEVVQVGENWVPAIKEPHAYVAWEQAWSPLYLDWAIDFYPTSEKDNTGQAAAGQVCDNKAINLSKWGFDGSDYNWQGKNPDKTPTGFNGRTFLTGQANFALISRLHQYLENAKASGKSGEDPAAGLQAIEDLIDQVGAMNFMSQQLTGLTDAMVMRTVNPGNPPSEDIAPYIGAQYNETPDPSKGDTRIRFGEVDPFFFPVRGGFMVFTRLEVVDAFGQNLNLMTTLNNNNTGAGFCPLRGAGLLPPETLGMNSPSKLQAVYLRPRVVQPARLNFDFLSSTDDAKILGQSAAVNPVCGWIIPNHLDRGLNVYDADGLGLGELISLAQTDGTHKLDWLATPLSEGAVTDPASIPDLHLRGFVQGLLNLGDEGVGFRSFLSCVDETQWTIDPLGGRKDQNLSVLIGRPLALVRCKLGFELDGLPYENQSWRDTLAKQGAGLDKQAFQIRMGSLDLFDDGLLGYYTDDNYGSFHCVHQPEGMPPANTYLSPIAEGSYLEARFDGTEQLLTMVLDPRGDVHLSTGILPVKKVSLPDEFVSPAMGQFAISFRAGPILSETEQVRIPYPTERHGAWSWAQLAAPTEKGAAADYVIKSLVKAGHDARLDSAPPALMEGWLTFKPDGKDNDT